MTPANTAALAVGGTVAVGALVFKGPVWVGLLLGSLAAFATKVAIDKTGA